MPVTSLPENPLDTCNLAPLSSDNYDQAYVQQPEKECSTSLTDCDSFEDSGIVFVGSYVESGPHTSSNLRGNPGEAADLEINDHNWKLKLEMLS